MKTIKINSPVYIPIFADGFKLAKCVVVGCRPFETSSTNFIYLVKTPYGEVQEAFASDMFESVEDFKNQLENFVIE